MGFFSDIFAKAVNEGEGAANSAIENVFHGSQHGDIVPAQNAAVAEMGSVLTTFRNNAYKSGLDYQNTENLIRGIAQRLSSYAATLGNARANRGASEVSALASRIVTDLESERGGQVNRSPYIPPIGSITSSPYFVPALVIAGAVILPKLLRKR